MRFSAILATTFSALFALTSGTSLATTHLQPPIKVKPDFSAKAEPSPRVNIMIARDARRVPGDMFDPVEKRVPGDMFDPNKKKFPGDMFDPNKKKIPGDMFDPNKKKVPADKLTH